MESVPKAYDGSQKVSAFHDGRARTIEREDAIEGDATPEKKIGQEKASTPTLHSIV